MARVGVRAVSGPVDGRSLGKYLAVVQVSLLSRLAYAGDALGRAGFMVLILFIFSQLWRQALPDGSDMAGFTAGQMVWYLMVTESLTLSRPAIEGAITEDVKSGNIAYQLIRPYGYVGYYLSLAMGEFLLRWPVNLLTGAMLAMWFVGTPFQLGVYILLGLLSALGGAVLGFLLTIGLALTAFWVEENRPFFWIYSKLVFTLGGLFVPVEVYPAWLRTVAARLPFEYMVSGPARLFVQFEWAFWRRIVWGQAMWLVVLLGVVWLLYRAGVKRVHVHGG